MCGIGLRSMLNHGIPLRSRRPRCDPRCSPRRPVGGGALIKRMAMSAFIRESFKHGSGKRVVGGRRFTDHTEKTLGAALSGTCLTLADVSVTGEVSVARTNERWLNAIATPLTLRFAPPTAAERDGVCFEEGVRLG